MVFQTAAEQVRENKPKINGSELISAPIALLSDQVTCKRCMSTTDQLQSPSLPSPGGQKLNQNVPPVTVDNTNPVSQGNSRPNEATPFKNAEELMRHILHDVRKLKAEVTRQGSALGERTKRRQDNAEELHQRKDKRPHRPWTPSSDDNHRYQLRTQDKCYDTTSTARYGRAKRDDVDSPERHRRFERPYDNLEPLTTRRTSRWKESADNIVYGRKRDNSPQTFPPQLGKHQSNCPPRQLMTSVGTPRQTLPPYRCLPPQNSHPDHDQQQQSYPQQIPMYPRQPRPRFFTPIQQVAAPVRQPLVFVPTTARHHY